MLIKAGMTVLTNERNELVSMRLVSGWRVCVDYQKLNAWTKKDHFPMTFMDQMLDRHAKRVGIAFLMAIRATIRSLSLQNIKKRPPSLVPIVLLHSK